MCRNHYLRGASHDLDGFLHPGSTLTPLDGKPKGKPPHVILQVAIKNTGAVSFQELAAHKHAKRQESYWEEGLVYQTVTHVYFFAPPKKKWEKNVRRFSEGPAKLMAF